MRTRKKRFKLLIAYDGRPYQGWQSQAHKETIQDYLEQALENITGQKIRIHGAGRTDTGVHAKGQIAHFETPKDKSLTNEKWQNALNAQIPPSIRIYECQEVREDFHARFSSIAKTYSYRICTDSILPPHLYGLRWHLPQEINLSTLKKSLALFIGKHNFQAFSAKRGNENEKTEYERTLMQAEVKLISQGFELIFTGDGFLYKMVRMLTGASIAIAMGKVSKKQIETLLQEGLKENSSRPLFVPAPANGLFLKKVSY